MLSQFCKRNVNDSQPESLRAQMNEYKIDTRNQQALLFTKTTPTFVSKIYLILEFNKVKYHL